MPPGNGSHARQRSIDYHEPLCLAWASRESRARLIDITAANLKAFLAGTPVNGVNG